MKVGTDGVLLDAWASGKGAIRILDVGTGCGLIALMLSQRYETAEVTGIEIDSSAVIDARMNVAASPFASRLRIVEGDIVERARNSEERFDLIVSNPPYHEEELLPPSEARAKARHTAGGGLTFAALLKSVKSLLAPGGSFALILPSTAAERFLLLALAYGLYPERRTEVVTREGKAPRRTLLQLSSRVLPSPVPTELVLQNATGGRSAAYSELCAEFYLKKR